jgi:hypothetical protein
VKQSKLLEAEALAGAFWIENIHFDKPAQDAEPLKSTEIGLKARASQL